MTNDHDTDTATPRDEQHDDQLPPRVRAALRDATVPIETTDPASDSDDPTAVGDDVAPVVDRLADAAVVGLGEATHGTREFFQLKHRVLRELVVEHGVRAVAMEANLPEAMALFDYVVDGDGDPREALAGVYFWTWQVESVLAMVEWLRAFNDGRPREDRVEVFGIDAQYTHGAVARLRDHLATVDREFLAAVADDLDTVDDDGEHPSQTPPEVIEERLQAGDRVLGRVREHLDAHRDAHVSTTSADAAERARRYVAVVEQALDYAETFAAGEDDLLEDDETMERLIRMRDRAMGDNVAWVREHADADGADDTLVVWAHDAHVNRVEQASPDHDPTAPSLGRHLADRHGDDYYALGFSFAGGAFQAMRESDDGEYELGERWVDGPVPGTFDAALDALDEPLAFVDVRAASADERTADWLATPREQFRTGATYDRDDPREQLVEYVHADAFDGVCFVSETTRARPLDTVDAPGLDDGEDDDGKAGGDEDDDGKAGDA